jgi:hypothetical protein
MNTQQTARLMQVIGGVIFAIGAILMAVGTTSIGLFLFYAVLAIAGLAIFLAGKKRYERTL